MKLEVLKYLEEDSRFRERSNKNKGIANLINKKYRDIIPQDKRDDIIGDILYADRRWRDELLNNPSLRGTDYEDKKVLEQKSQQDLGYQAGFEQDIKVFDRL